MIVIEFVKEKVKEGKSVCVRKRGLKDGSKVERG
jgi:hypothetical protein